MAVNVLLVLFFLVLGGVFAAAEMALVSLSEAQIRAIERSGRSGAKIAALARNPNRFLSAIQIGVTLSGFFSAAYGGAALAPSLSPVLSSWGLPRPTAEAAALVVMTLLIAYLSLVFSELVPKRLAMQNAAGFTRVLAPALNAFAAVMRPMIGLLSASTNAVVRLLGGNPSLRSRPMSSEELYDMVSASPVLAEDSRRILSDVFGAGKRRLQEVMRPRPQVRFLRADLTLEEARRHVLDLPYSRYPVIGESPDDVLGFIHVRDLMPVRDAGTDRRAAREGTLRDITRPILFMPGTAMVLPTLTRMRREQDHIAVVVDEYGGTDGIVTLEDLVEELVGEIYDEFDAGADPEDRSRRDEGILIVDGALILQEFARLSGVELPEGQYETVAGYILERLGRIARPGDEVAGPGCTLRVLGVQGNRIGSVRVTPQA